MLFVEIIYHAVVSQLLIFQFFGEFFKLLTVQHVIQMCYDEKVKAN